MTKKSYKFRFYPTKEQSHQLDIEFGNARFVWNWALSARKKAYERRNESYNYIILSRLLTKLKKSKRYSWLNNSTADCSVQKLRDLDVAYKNFFRKNAAFPKYKRKNSAQSIRYQINIKMRSIFFSSKEYIKLPKLGKCKLRWSNVPLSIPKMVTVSKDSSGRFFLSFTVEEKVKLLPLNESAIGIDMGLKDVVVTSKGFKSGAPKYFKQHEKKLAKAQRKLTRMKIGSNRRNKQRERVAKIHAKIKDSRNDFLHKLSWKLINENQVIGIEDLCVKGMTRTKLAKSVNDTGMRELRRQLEYKANWYGRQLEVIDRFEPTSKTCSSCGHKMDEMNLSVREWVCPKCNTKHDRDINAAINIFNIVGHTRINARGESLNRGN